MNDITAAAVVTQQPALFHLTGRHPGPGAASIEGLGVRPASFARLHDLTRLRYDFPLVLAAQGGENDYVRSLSERVDDVLRTAAPAGIAGERFRRNVLRVEREVRVLLDEGAAGTLGELWDQAAARLVARGREGMQDDLARARTALGADGRLADCDRALPAQLATHAWRTVQQAKARAMRAEIETLVVRLADLIKADHLRSGAGRSAANLASGFGASHRALFDFDAMARLLARPSGPSGLSDARRRRIEWALDVLNGQQFFVAGGGHGFEFGDAAEAVAAYRRRLPELAQLSKAMTIADLEVHGRYNPARHDALFEGWSADSLRPQDLARFPDYLVCGSAAREAFAAMAGHERALLLEALSSGAPVKIVVDSGPLLEDSLPGDRALSLGAQIAFAATGIEGVYVLQAAASHLYRVRGRLLEAMRYGGPALVSVYAGESDPSGRRATPAYLTCAAATEARVFPVFCYDPGAGANWADRFALEANPQPEADWPRHEIAWADAQLQRNAAAQDFTLADYALCVPGLARHFAAVGGEGAGGELVPVAEWLAHAANGAADKVPFVHAVDGANRLRKLVVDDKLVQAARRCAESWRRLRELEGLKNKGKPVAPAPVAEAAPVATPVAAKAAQSAPPAEAGAPPAEQAADARAPGEPYIETERCSSCNECTTLNNAMFAYNENKQAYIANPDAGTFRELVEAAESCQVAVIHPGKPRNKNEPGLEELLKRAEPFQ